MKSIHVASDFSPTPAGRYRSDGPHSGQAFREDILVPNLASDEVEVFMDGGEGYGSSFLEEAFGGLVRVEGLEKEQIHKMLNVKSDDQALKEEIRTYVDEA